MIGKELGGLGMSKVAEMPLKIPLGPIAHRIYYGSALPTLENLSSSLLFPCHYIIPNANYNLICTDEHVSMTDHRHFSQCSYFTLLLRKVSLKFMSKLFYSLASSSCWLPSVQFGLSKLYIRLGLHVRFNFYFYFFTVRLYPRIIF